MASPNYKIDISDYETDPRLFLFTSLTAGSSHIITATSRLETILKANKLPFQAVDLATDEKARRLWQRRARERKLPGLVKGGSVVGDLDEIEEWNEFGELKENIGPLPANVNTDTSQHTVKTGVNIAPPIPVKPTATQGTAKVGMASGLGGGPGGVNKAPRPGVDESKFRPLPGAGELRERHNQQKAEKESGASNETEKAEETKTEGELKGAVSDENAPPAAAETMSSSPNEKRESVQAAKDLLSKVQSRGEEHLSAPPSAAQSGTGTPKSEGREAAQAAPRSAPDTAQKEEAAQTEGEGEGEKLVHRGSEVKVAPDEEVKKVESETSLAETAEEEGEAKEVKGVGATDAGEGKVAESVGEQSAKAGGDAGKSVGD